MVTPQQRDAISEFIRDSFLERLDAEPGFAYEGSRTPAYGWIGRFNSVGLIMPRIDLLWEPWWASRHTRSGRAALQYCSGLMYLEGENPLFETMDAGTMRGRSLLVGDRQPHPRHGMEAARTSTSSSRTLTADFVEDRVVKAVAPA